MSRPSPVIAIHGGAGTITRAELTPDQEKSYLGALTEIVLAGQKLLAEGVSALDAVTDAVRLLENCPLFNAGKGAVFAADGTHELDAAVMDGATLAAGAVTCVRRLPNPILAARAVMEHSQHVLLTGEGAEAFARTHGLPLVEQSYFYTDFRYQQLQRAKERAAAMLDHDGASLAAQSSSDDQGSKCGTVGAVALDAAGHLAAATSTGGMTNKLIGRVGDTPLIGCGSYADANVAVSCTGVGEFFIRLAAAHDVAAQIEYAGKTLADATRHTIWEKMARIQGRGGLIAVDRFGEVALPFNTEGMYRGFARVGEPPQTGIFAER